MPTQKEILKNLDTIEVPGVMRSLVKMNLIRDVSISDGKVDMQLSSTALTPEYQEELKDKINEAIRQRFIHRIGKPKANVVMGRRLLRILYAMIRDEKPFARGPATQHNRGANRARLARKQRKEVA